ncbi:MAG: DUF6160 family protein [Telluria sp.]
MKRLLAAVAMTGACTLALAGPQRLDDEQLSNVRGRDGVSFAIHLELNTPNRDGTPNNNLLWIGHQVDGHMTYLVIRNLSGVVDMTALNIAANTSADGQSYLAFTLPNSIRFTNAGFESLSVQADPAAPVTSSMGRFTLNGEMTMQGQLRMWPH